MALITKKEYNRDLSWLRFNHRVLQEAADDRNPLVERLKFLAIFSSNLDEFFKVRVSEIRKIKELDKPLRKKLITKPNRLLAKIKTQVDLQQKEFGKIFYTILLPALEKEDIFFKNIHELNDEGLAFAKAYYKKVKHLFEPMTDKAQTFIENEALYLVGHLKDDALIWVKISGNTSRFLEIPTSDKSSCIIFIDDILKLHLKEEFQTDFYSIKISRDAELYIDNEYSGDLLEKIKEALPNRITGQVTRALIDEMMPHKLLKAVEKELDINATDIIKGGAYHNFKDFFGFPKLGNKNLYFKDLPPVKHKELKSIENIFKAIDEKDQLLCFPYDSYDSVLNFIETAAVDPFVTSIKITLYRVSNDSTVAQALVKAAQNGKDVFVFIETKARFDEANNIKWGKRLEENGADVKYSYPGIKVHSKTLYIERNENDNPTCYAFIGTGNFNEKTATIYTDFSLITSNSKITSEILQVFQVLDRKLFLPKTKQLLISPFSTRSTFEELIKNEIKLSKKGEDAYITLKMNSLQDQDMIRLLYKANNAGVKIRLLIRGICCLVPRINGQSEHIKVTSIVDRFLEHGRIYIFGNGGKEKMYIGSADWMTRNLDHRIEVITPILDKDIAFKLRNILNLQLNDHIKGRLIDAKQENKYLNTNSDSELSSQYLIYKSLL
ncbi:MAG: polyphosphate kinase 1 [Nonlabens ulvanivorans]|uniref:polyphosphate kinase 1 n=2 Tax=Nonlabens ulvanivorans TaxID=906888 RepID=UPI003265AC7C